MRPDPGPPTYWCLLKGSPGGEKPWLFAPFDRAPVTQPGVFGEGKKTPGPEEPATDKIVCQFTLTFPLAVDACPYARSREKRGRKVDDYDVMVCFD